MSDHDTVSFHHGHNAVKVQCMDGEWRITCPCRLTGATIEQGRVDWNTVAKECQ